MAHNKVLSTVDRILALSCATLAAYNKVMVILPCVAAVCCPLAHGKMTKTK